MSGLILSSVPEEFNVADLHLDRWIREGLSNKIALIDRTSNEFITYGELYTLSCKLANLLTEHSIEMFDKIMIAMRDSKFSVAAFLAAIRAGAVPFYVNPNFTIEEFRFYIRDSICRAIISDDTTANNLKIAVSEYGKHVKVLINVDDAEFSSLLKDMKDHFPPIKTHRDDPAYMVYTSGTTGRPKGVVHLHHDLVYAVAPYVTHIIDIRPNDLFYSTSKLYFSAGRMFGLHIPLMCGVATLIDPVRSSPERVLDNLSRFDVTHLLSVPTLYLRMVNHLEETGARLSIRSLRYCISGGEPLPVAVFERWKQITGLEILNGIGSSEAEWIFISYKRGDGIPGSSGKVIPGWKVRLIDESGKEIVDAYKIGVLHVSNDSVAAFYWRRCEESQRTFIGSWYNTKDMMYFDHEGNFYYVGRSDDMFKVHGLWVSPVEVENSILDTGLVKECAVVGIQSKEGLTEVVAFIVPKEVKGADLEHRLKENLAKRLPSFKIPKRIIELEDIPKTITGKIKRTELKELAIRILHCKG